MYSRGVRRSDYVSKNTYLCQYHSRDLEEIRKLEFVVYVDYYRTIFKITPRLRELKEASPDQNYEVDIVFHQSGDSFSPPVQSALAAKSGCSVDKIGFFPDKARLTTKGLSLDDIASIDDVRYMEDVGEVVTYNDEARKILRLDSQPSIKYQGSGQIVAVADSGLHEGMDMPDHPAFTGRVRHWLPEHGSTEDCDGHGTHVCGSAVGNGMAGNVRVMGAAPRAELIVQSIWNSKTRTLSPPPTLTTLFDHSYLESARVHSNSWGRSYRRKDAQGNSIPFQQMGYTTGSTETDDFVCKHPEMVICFAAGNDGREPMDPPGTGHIGAEAAAKNCITVGASRSSRRFQNWKADNVADFSSHGPTLSRRRKPDVIAPGTFILSTNSGKGPKPEDPDPDSNWCYMSGTSMATPLVAGCAAVLRETLTNHHPTITPTAPLIKALLINGADILKPITSNFVPKKDSGFGRVNMTNTIGIVCGESGGFLDGVVDRVTPDWYEKIEFQPKNATLKATLVWSDPPGEDIKNALHLRLGDKTGKWKRSFSNNNVQQVVLNNISGYVMLNVYVIGGLEKFWQVFTVVWRLC